MLDGLFFLYRLLEELAHCQEVRKETGDLVVLLRYEERDFAHIVEVFLSLLVDELVG